jgi:chemotaxis protein methyltransferase CheR
MHAKRQIEVADLPSDDAPLDDAREFDFSDTDFRHLADLAKTHSGISLGESKRNLVYSRLSRRLRALGFSTFRQYRALLQSPEGKQEVENFINSISTNLTRLFRESHHFDHLRTNVTLKFGRAGARDRLRIWSAGCSTGEEPYSIAAVLRRDIVNVGQRDVRILATDIDTQVLEKGAAGEYPRAALDEVPSEYRDVLRPEREQVGKTFTMGEDLRDLIRFRWLNLMEPWPFAGPFDAIFCRNVMIYFDAPTKQRLVERFAEKLRPGGWLYIGHSETLHGGRTQLELVGRTVYRRVG